MKKCVFAVMLAMFAPFISGDAECATKIYRRVSSTKKSSGPTTTFYYNQSNRRKYGAQVEPVKSEVVVQQPVVVETVREAAPAPAPVKYTETVTRYEEPPATYSEAATSDSYVAQSYSEKKQTQRKTKYSQERKYFLAHPFFQPLKNNFGSITDIGFAKNSFGFDFLNSSVYNQAGDELGQLTYNFGGKAETSQFLVKQDFSFGLTDKLAIVVMGQYDSTDVTFKDWTDGSLEVKNSNSGVNVFGFGAQLRFLDVRDSIGMLSVYYESQKDTTDSVLADLKLGYKFDRTTLYLIGRGGYSSLKQKNASYGVYVEDNTGDYMLLSYKRNINDLFFGEGGLGIFSVLNKYFTFNAEALYGSYDWHNKLTARAEFGVQPFDSLALGIYVSGTLYDSADGKQKEFVRQDVNPTYFSSEPIVWEVGNYKIRNYNEYQIGGRLILHF